MSGDDERRPHQRLRVLVLYHSRHGNTRFLAEAIAAATGANRLEIGRGLRLRETYDLVFLGSPVRFGGPAGPVRAFARRLGPALSAAAIAPFCCCAVWPGLFFRRIRCLFAPRRILPGIAFRSPLRRDERTEARRAVSWARRALRQHRRTGPERDERRAPR